MEGAVGERLKREYQLNFDEQVALAGLVYEPNARRAMRHIFEGYALIAEKYQLPFMATTPTRRANRERVTRSNFSETIIRDNVNFLREIQRNVRTEMFVGGLMGCKGDAYRGTEVLSTEDACVFHAWQADLFKKAGVDYLFAGIMPALTEAAGMAKAMEATGLPYIISFMIRDNGRLIDGTTIHDAVAHIDQMTTQKPLCYMTNCVHPIVLGKALSYEFNQTPLVKERFQGIQANTSPLPPEELDRSEDLKASDPISLASDMLALKKIFIPKIFGGCCGTDYSHMEEIAKMVRDSF